MVEFVSGSIMIRPMGKDGNGLAPGEIVHGHKHHFDHTTICFCGDWHVKKWASDGELVHDFKRTGPFHLLIEAEATHEFIFLGGAPTGYAYCVYSHRTPQGEVSLIETGWIKAYEASASLRSEA